MRHPADNDALRSPRSRLLGGDPDVSLSAGCRDEQVAGEGGAVGDDDLHAAILPALATTTSPLVMAKRPLVGLDRDRFPILAGAALRK
jgi:hypothetical protein